MGAPTRDPEAAPVAGVPEPVAARLLSDGPRDASDWLVLVAHPDDETLALGGRLARLRGVKVVVVTDGAPSDPRFWPDGFQNRLDYAACREREFRAAMAAAGIPAEQTRLLAFEDLTLMRRMIGLVGAVRGLLRAFRPRAVLTHACEGGHPDHDAVALAARAAARLVERELDHAIVLLETPAYHREDHGPAFGHFADGGAAALNLRVAGADLDIKRQMLSAYASQAAMVDLFDATQEAVRPVPRDPGRWTPPEGTLLYDDFGFPADRRDLADAARIARRLAMAAPS